MNDTNRIDRTVSRSFLGWSTTLGIGMIILGIVTIVFSVLTTFATIILLGAVIIIRGVIEIIYAARSYHHEGFWMSLFGGILALIIGLLILIRPGIAAATITLFIAAFLFISGLYRLISAFIEPQPHRALVVFSSILSLALGALIWSGWPVSALWFIGLLIGVEILSTGIVMTLFPFALRRAVRSQERRNEKLGGEEKTRFSH